MINTLAEALGVDPSLLTVLSVYSGSVVYVIGYLGRFIDQDTPLRDLPNLGGTVTYSSERLAECNVHCKEMNQKYFAPGMCWCGNDYGEHGSDWRRNACPGVESGESVHRMCCVGVHAECCVRGCR